MKTINDYAELVKAEHALNKTIAPVEDGANIAGSYTSGKQFIRGGVLYTALTTIAANTAWSSLTLDTDYELADDITSQLASLNQTLTNKTDGIVANINANGSKNILPFDLAECIALNTSGTWSGNKHSARGIELTYNDDGTVTLDGTTTDAGGDQYAEFELESGKTYIYSIGNPFNLSATAGSNLQGYNGTSWVTLVNIYDTGKEAEFTTSDTYSKYRVNINANNGVTFSNFTIKPMICSNSDYALSSDYVPYAKTNRELTEIAEILADKGFLNVPNGENAPNINPDNHKTVGLWRYKINNVDYYGFSFIFNKDWVCQIRTQTR